MKRQLNQIKLLQKSKSLQLQFDDGAHFELPCSYCRVFSPASDNQLQQHELDDLLDQDINITAIEPIGNYAVKLHFSDGHQTGIYHWDYLYELGQQYHATL